MGSFKKFNACPIEHFNFQNALTFVQNRFHLIMCPPDTLKPFCQVLYKFEATYLLTKVNQQPAAHTTKVGWMMDDGWTCSKHFFIGFQLPDLLTIVMVGSSVPVFTTYLLTTH
jgi:hypothetical protein